MVEVCRASRHGQVYKVPEQQAFVAMRLFGTPLIELLPEVLLVAIRHAIPLVRQV
jgi:hypothetical protein